MRTGDEPPLGGATPGPGDSPLPAIDAAAAVIHHGFAEMLQLTIHAQSWGGTQQTAGWTVDGYLQHEAGLPSWLAGQLVAVADRIEVVPFVADLSWAGVLSFDQLAQFVRTSSVWNGELLARTTSCTGRMAGRTRRTTCSPRAGSTTCATSTDSVGKSRSIPNRVW